MDAVTETKEEGHCHGGKDGKHTWRFSNSHNLYYCTTPGCRETWDDQS
jgi:hypothetical protein